MSVTMTNRERYLATMRFEEVDRLIRHEAIGVDEETYARWKAAGWTPERGDDFFGESGMDYFAPAFFGSYLHPGFYPAFTEEVLEDHGHRQVVRTEAGATVERMCDGSMSIPRFLRFPVEDLDD